jgi:hypothetical protein
MINYGTGIPVLALLGTQLKLRAWDTGTCTWRYTDEMCEYLYSSIRASVFIPIHCVLVEYQYSYTRTGTGIQHIYYRTVHYFYSVIQVRYRYAAIPISEYSTSTCPGTQVLVPLYRWRLQKRRSASLFYFLCFVVAKEQMESTLKGWIVLAEYFIYTHM